MRSGNHIGQVENTHAIEPASLVHQIGLGIAHGTFRSGDSLCGSHCFQQLQGDIKADHLPRSWRQHQMGGIFQPDYGARLFHQAVLRIINLDNQTGAIAVIAVDPLFGGAMGRAGNFTLTKNNTPLIGALGEKYQLHFLGDYIRPFFRQWINTNRGFSVPFANRRMEIRGIWQAFGH